MQGVAPVGEVLFEPLACADAVLLSMALGGVLLALHSMTLAMGLLASIYLLGELVLWKSNSVLRAPCCYFRWVTNKVSLMMTIIITRSGVGLGALFSRF